MTRLALTCFVGSCAACCSPEPSPVRLNLSVTGLSVPLEDCDRNLRCEPEHPQPDTIENGLSFQPEMPSTVYAQTVGRPPLSASGSAKSSCPGRTGFQLCGYPARIRPAIIGSSPGKRSAGSPLSSADWSGLDRPDSVQSDRFHPMCLWPKNICIPFEDIP